MWILYAFGSALFAGITSILAKCGIKKTDSHVATALRTIIVLIFSWLMVFIVQSQNQISTISNKTWLFLILSGFATGASWLCYFKALQLGYVNKVVPIDKSSTIITMILAFIFLKEEMTLLKGVCVILIGIGTYMMIDQKESTSANHHKSWLIYALLSAIFASLTSILGKVGMQNIDSNLGTAIRTVVVLFMSWVVVFVTHKQHTLKEIDHHELLFICLSGIATGLSWLCYYRALQLGLASIVVPIDKLSIVVTIIFSYVVFHERLNKKSFIGLMSMIVGTLLMII